MTLAVGLINWCLGELRNAQLENMNHTRVEGKLACQDSHYLEHLYI